MRADKLLAGLLYVAAIDVTAKTMRLDYVVSLAFIRANAMRALLSVIEAS